MPRGRHRRVRPSATRRVSRLSALLAVGGAGIAAPLVTAGSAHAAPAPAHAPAVAQQQAPKAAPQHTADKPEQAANYTVADGDTLFLIARAHDVKGGWEALYEANRDVVGADANLIHPGQELALQGAKAQDAGKAARGETAASRSAERTAPSTKQYADNLDGWINEALDIMKQHGIPGTYEGIHRNIMRESGGDPNIANNWDINAQNGTPSIGLLQVIKPTFDAYHVEGTAFDQRDPVANIVAACNYAADRYGSIDNVNGPY